MAKGDKKEHKEKGERKKRKKEKGREEKGMSEFSYAFKIDHELSAAALLSSSFPSSLPVFLSVLFFSSFIPSSFLPSCSHFLPCKEREWIAN